jgi:hypothetical protein
LTLLKEAGLDFCCLALESGSERINKDVLRRTYRKELFLKTAWLCRELSIKFYTDVIAYNPYEEVEDLRRTLDVLMEMGGGFGLCVNKLFVLPGTAKAQIMERDGMDMKIADKREALFNTGSTHPCRMPYCTRYQAVPNQRGAYFLKTSSIYLAPPSRTWWGSH